MKENFYFDIALIDGTTQKFEAHPLREYKSYINVPGIAVLIRCDVLGNCNRIIKVEGDSIGDLLFNNPVKDYVKDSFHYSYHFAFLHLDDKRDRLKLFKEIRVPSL